MKIAVFEPFPRMCGVTKWTFEVAHGFKALGHHTDVISFSKSGRRRVTEKKRRFDGSLSGGWHWWPEAPDVQGRWVDAPLMLDGYDLIVLNEPKNGTVDRDAQKQKLELPEYITALRDVKTPWLTILHAPQYDQKTAPFLETMMACPSFTGFAIEHQPGSYASGEWALKGPIKKLQPWPWLPYRQKAGEHGSIAREWTIAIGGRFVTNKGHHMFAWLADRFPAYCRARLLGSESGGAGPAASFEVYEALVRHHGWSGARVGGSEPDELNNHGDKIHCWPWWLAKTGDDGQQHVLEYTGGYDSPVVEWQRVAISVNLTSSKFAVGLEYTSLEAMDAGCAIVLPAYSVERTGSEQYSAHVLSKFTAPLTMGKSGIRLSRSNPDEIEDVIHAVSRADQAIHAGEHDPAMNRKALAEYHDPVHLARAILEGV